MLLISHPTGNQFVRALLDACETRQLDYRFCTTLAFRADAPWLRVLPGRLRAELLRRDHGIPAPRCLAHPWREAARLLAQRALPRVPAMFSVDAVYQSLDRRAAAWLRRQAGRVAAVHAYEDGALETFQAARAQGARCSYELPIAYWETSRRLLREEAERWPEWEPTLGATSEPPEKLERKTRELALADRIVCPSAFVQESVPEIHRPKCVVAEFGSPAHAALPERAAPGNGPLRFLFAGSFTQRKGLADLFAALRLLGPAPIELVLMGSPILPLDFYRRAGAHFTYEPTRPHAAVLELMTRCDVLVLPSIVEGRALVQQEALSCGLPLLVTPNAGGADLIEPGRTGFLVPIRSPAALAEKMQWFIDHRGELPALRAACRAKAQACTWTRYAERILTFLNGK